MAQDKKSVVLYCDVIHTVEKLSNENAGLLFKHYLRYINDLNPDAPNELLDVVFEPIKQQLKRDLKEWDKTKEGYSKGGKASAEKRIKLKLVEPTLSKSTVNVTVNDNVTDITKVDMISNWFKDLENSSYLEDIARNSKLRVDYVKSQIEKFRAKAELSYPTYEKFISHFKNFVNKTATNDTKITTKSTDGFGTL